MPVDLETLVLATTRGNVEAYGKLTGYRARP